MSSKRKELNRLVKLDRPEYFGRRITQLMKELNSNAQSTNIEIGDIPETAPQEVGWEGIRPRPIVLGEEVGEVSL